MAIDWGAWEYSGGNGMRVGMDVSTSAVSHTSTSVTFTVKYYTENQYNYSDNQTLSYSGSIGGSTDFSNTSNGGAVLRATKSYTYTYGSTEYGSSPGNKSFTATLSGAYNGVTPSNTTTKAIPARPYAAPAAPDTVNSAYNSDTQITTTWQRNPTSGEPYDSQTLQRWDNVSAAWTTISLSSTATSYANTGLSANRRYRFQIRANNSVGSSAYIQGPYIQTTPAAPSSASATKASNSSITISWTNNASSTNYDYTTDLEESVNGGAYSVVANIAEGTSSTTRTGLNAGSTYTYRVRAKSTTGATTYSTYSTTSTVQLTAPPAAVTSLSVTRNSDTSYSLSWTDHPTTDAPYDGITIQRWDNVGGSWATVANLAGTATSVTDTGTVVDRKYQWRVIATNAGGSSPNTDSSFYWTTPDAPSSVSALYSGGTDIAVSWTNNESYSEYTTTVRWYKDNVLQSSTSLGSGTSSYTLTGVTVTSTYKFEVQAVAANGGWTSAWIVSNNVMGAAPPNAPTNLSPTANAVRDLAKTNAFTWTHSPSQDGSGQKKFEIQHREVGTGTWTSTGTITSTASTWTMPAGTYANPKNVEWQVRTWGVHANPGPWSSTATLLGSTTPTVTLVSPGSSLPVSAIAVDWDYYDAEGTTQAAFELSLYDQSGTLLLESAVGTSATAYTFAYSATDGASYQLTLRVQDGSGLWSDLLTRAFTADFIPPAESLLTADLDPNSGSVVLTLTPTPNDGGVTSLPATSVTVERQVFDPETETYGAWETVISGVAPDATVVDTTAPIHNDGYYRVTTYSAAPSSRVATQFTYSSTYEDKWLYVSGGPNFSVVCRMWANIELSWKASRDKALYNFAGRSQPVMFSGQSTSKSLSVSGLVPLGDGSPESQWLKLAKQPGPVLLRAPGRRRIFGALSEVQVDYIHPTLIKVSFDIEEVWRP